VTEARVSVVTGASRGIGRAIALELARAGGRVVLSGRDEAALAEVERAALAAGGEAVAIPGDAAEPGSAERLVETALSRFGRLDNAIANAGQALDGLILRMKPEQLDLVLSVNLKSAFFLSMAAAKPMVKQRGGSIVLMSSIVGLAGNAGQAGYAAAKAGLLGLAKSLAKELGSRNVRVNAVAPGFIETAMTAALSDQAREHFLRTVPLGRAGTPEDVSGVVAFLCSDAARYVTGQVVVVDGGAL
jgi:3-oxoacyl-[acyl-carrier protein] reductase